MQCEDCNRSFKNKRGLAAHRRGNKCAGTSRKQADIVRLKPNFDQHNYTPVKLKGAPTQLDQPSPNNPDICIGDAIIRNLASGSYIETSASVEGVPRGTIQTWLKEGARTRAGLNNGNPETEYTSHELLLADFSRAVSVAVSQAETVDLTRHAQIARGGLKRGKTRTVVKEYDDGSIERTTTTDEETLLPDARALEWRLQHRHAHWRNKESVELTGVDGGPIEVDLDVAAASLAAKFKTRFVDVKEVAAG